MRHVFHITLISFLFAIWSCAPVVVKPSPLAKVKFSAAQVADTPYRIGPGDEIDIKFFLTPELNTLVQVRPDGKISIMFAQNIKAAGKTPEELALLIQKKISSHIKQADIVVSMHNFASQRVYVGGEVMKPGPVQLLGRESLMQVLIDAGWLTPMARHDEVVLVRRASNGEEEVFPINTVTIVSGEDMTQNVPMQAGDLVLVPPSGPVVFDRWVDRNIRMALPFSTSVGAIYTNQYNGTNR